MSARTALPFLAGNRQLGTAVHRHRALSRDGLLERAFTRAFSGLVYPQIWEDPVVDMAALEITPDCDMVTIASGGCNALSYLAANPRSVTAVDLNASHVALGELKRAALLHLSPNELRRFIAEADHADNVRLYDTRLAHRLPAAARDYWQSRDLRGRRMIARFAGNFYRYGLLGRFIGFCHVFARLYRADLSAVLAARTRREAQDAFAREIAPVLDKGLMRWLLSKPAAYFGLGIPPAQFDALQADGGGDMAAVVRERLERLACGFAPRDNYFAWQAFGRRYAPEGAGALPPWLDPVNRDMLRDRAVRLAFRNISLTDHLRDLPVVSLDRYVLLDAQDWMSDEQLTDLWAEITRTARPGARVIFRTAAAETVLPGRVPKGILRQWHYCAERSAALFVMDRSAIYGGFHLYRFKG